MKFKKGSYEIICRPNEEHQNNYLKTVTGYLFEMDGYAFGVNKDIYQWIVTDLKTGRSFTIGERRKDAVERIESNWLRYLEIISLELYKQYVKNFEKAKMEENI